MENPYLKKVGTTYRKQTKSLSNVTRQISFSLLAILWALSYNDGILKISKDSYWAMGALVLFLIFDSLQYLITALLYRRHFKRLAGSFNRKKQTDEALILQDKIERTKIDNLSYRLLIVKVCFLPISFFFIVLTIINKL